MTLILKADSLGAERESKIITKVPRLQIIHLDNLTSTLCIWYYQAVLLILLLLNDAHYKSDCILLAIFREMLNKSYFKLLAYVPTLPRLLVLHKMLQRFLWNNSKYYRNPRALLSRVGCVLHERCRLCIDHFAWHSPGGARVLHGKVVSFCIDIFIFVSMYRIVHKISRCTDISMYRFTPNQQSLLILRLTPGPGEAAPGDNDQHSAKYTLLCTNNNLTFFFPVAATI